MVMLIPMMLVDLMSLISRYVFDFQYKNKSSGYLVLVGLVYFFQLCFLSSFSGSNPQTAKTSYRNGMHLNTIAGLVYSSFTDLGSMSFLMTNSGGWLCCWRRTYLAHGL